mmetsp:Transcript_11603/g.25837  ORF Transcript_11603/g.25837 Transcript_11603/m.25837 type:complete len:367 (-) Transcript_11603:86-1186(-)
MKVQVQAEDFGGGLALPHFGYGRPSSDYYNSNLIIQNFVIANVNDNANYVWLYDERGQGKGADCLCSLRMRYHLQQWERYAEEERPKISLSILDNCVGQNKSNTVMKFNALLSILFYVKVALLFLVPGHSHMLPDRVVAWMKGSIRGKNLYHPQDIAAAANGIKTVHAEFLDHTSHTRPFFINWDSILDKYFHKMPELYTKNYYFEFENGVATYRFLTTTPDTEAIRFNLVKGDVDVVRRCILRELFGVSEVSSLSSSSLQFMKLPRHPGVAMTKKKVESISQKYFSIPEKYLPYYPKADTPPTSASTLGAGISAFVGDAIPKPTEKRKSDTVAVEAKKPGRPKNNKPNADIKNTSSILSFFKSAT